MKQYQVSRKRQITIPKNLAEKRGIRPGDSVSFEETTGGIIIKKASESEENYTDLKKAVEGFLVRDAPKIRKRLKTSESALIESISRHVSVKRR